MHLAAETIDETKTGKKHGVEEVESFDMDDKSERVEWIEKDGVDSFERIEQFHEIGQTECAQRG